MSVSTNVSVWFACKLCTSYFIKVSDFIEHKKKDHLEEFQKSSCIVFEERTVSTHESTEEVYNGSLLPVAPLPTVSPKVQKNVIPTQENLPSPSSPGPGLGPGPGPSSNVIVITQILEPEFNYDPNTVTVDLHYDSHSLDSTTLQNFDTDQNQGFNFSPFIDPPHKPSQVGSDAVSNEFGNESVKSGDDLLFNADDNELELKPDQLSSGLEVKPQLVTFGKSSAPSPSPTPQNPAVLIKRLTSKQIHTASSSIVPAPMHNINSRLEENKNISQKDIYILPDALANSLALTPTNSIIECTLCLKKFDSDSELKTHIGIACDMYDRFRRRYCIPCNRKFNNKEACANHHLRFHATEEEKRKRSKLCGVCGKTFIRNSDLKEHVLKKHIGVPRPRPFKCILCNFGFQTRFALTSHLRTHSDDKPFKCSHPNCEMAFKLKSYLTQHLKSHSDYRPFPCTELACGKSFKTRRHLANHMITHTDFRPFQCSEPNCRKTFQLVCSLNKHRQIHTRAKETAADPTTATTSDQLKLSYPE